MKEPNHTLINGLNNKAGNQLQRENFSPHKIMSSTKTILTSRR